MWVAASPNFVTQQKRGLCGEAWARPCSSTQKRTTIDSCCQAILEGCPAGDTALYVTSSPCWAWAQSLFQ